MRMSSWCDVNVTRHSRHPQSTVSTCLRQSLCDIRLLLVEYEGREEDRHLVLLVLAIYAVTVDVVAQ